jgi:hypothetical protein
MKIKLIAALRDEAICCKIAAKLLHLVKTCN